MRLLVVVVGGIAALAPVALVRLRDCNADFERASDAWLARHPQARSYLERLREAHESLEDLGFGPEQSLRPQAVLICAAQKGR